jgi:Xaa-Pro aminopeptidase
MHNTIPEKEILKRIDGLKKHLRENCIEFALIQQNVDKFYFTGTFQDGVLFVPGDGEEVLFIRRSLERAQEESPLHLIQGYGSFKEIHGYIIAHGFKKGAIGLEMDVLPSFIYKKIESLFHDSSFIDISAHIRRMRSIKSSFEISKFLEAGKRLDNVFERIKDEIKPGVIEYEIYRLFIGELIKEGSSPCIRSRRFNVESLPCYIMCGSNAHKHSMIDSPSAGGEGVSIAYPAGAGHKKLENGESIIIDTVFNLDGYNLDCTRIFAIGTLDDCYLHAHSVSGTCHEYFKEAVQEYRSIQQIYRDIVEIVEKEKLADVFMGGVKFIGHGIGLELDELPVLTEQYQGYVEEGMVIAFEPKFVFEGGTVGYETAYYVKDRKCIALNKYSSAIQMV